MSRWRVYLCAAFILWVGAGCSSSAQQMRDSSYDYSGEGAVQVSANRGRTESISSEARPSSDSGSSYSFASDEVRGSMVTPASAPQASAPDTPSPGGGAPGSNAGGGQAATSMATPKSEEATKTAPLLIYNGTVLLALYDVAETQEAIIKLVESEGGWVSTRSTNQVILRVPAAKFRDTLDQLAGMGDVLDLKWQAEDVTAVVRDTRIRLDSALKMRTRLEELLVKAEDVKDALAIEQQLGRVILEIEQLQATLRGYKDRIAYSTITVEFRAKLDRALPNTEYALPFSWIDGLGVQRLLQIPRI